MSIFYDDLICYKQLSITHDGKLKFFLEKHSTKEGTWGLLTLHQGEIDFVFLDGCETELSRTRLNANNPSIIIPPATWHKIIPISTLFNATLQFYCKPHRYFNKKYKLNRVHTDLYSIYNTYLQQEKNLNILDVGCGSGRNLLFLALKGHTVTGIDRDESAIAQIKQIAQDEKMNTVVPVIQDLHHPLNLQQNAYNLIISTVSLQFLQPIRIPSLLMELQQATANQGFHFLVFPIKSTKFTLPGGFTYLADSYELYDYYQNSGWSILEYQESVGQLHKVDEAGKPVQGMFALLLAQKN